MIAGKLRKRVAYWSLAHDNSEPALSDSEAIEEQLSTHSLHIYVLLFNGLDGSHAHGPYRPFIKHDFDAESG